MVGIDERSRYVLRIVALAVLVAGVAPVVWAQSGSRTMPRPARPPLGSTAPAASTVTSGGKKIVDVQIVGNRTVKIQEIRAELETRVGYPLDPAKVRTDVRSLTKMGRFFDVQVKTRPGPQPGTVVVIFQVFEFSKLEYVYFLGNDAVSTRALRKESGLKVSDPLDAVAIESAQKKLVAFYKDRGYNRATIRIREGLERTDHGAVFAIHEGPQQRIWSVEFVGNTIVAGGRLKTQIKSKPSKIKYLTPLAKGYVERRKIDEDVHRITSYYRGLGYMLARVGRDLKMDKEGRWATLTFVIDEGPRFVVRDISFVGNDTFPNTQLQPLMKLQPGEYFDLSSMKKDVESLTLAYGSVGYILADIQPSPRTLESTPELDLVYNISEGGRYKVGRINVTINGDNPHTRHSTVLNRLSLRPGQIIDIREIRKSERLLGASGLFLRDPARGIRPQIVFQKPERKESVATRPNSSNRYRGQSPDPGGSSGAGHTRLHSRYDEQPNGGSTSGRNLW